jgi:hypothetical protein
MSWVATAKAAASTVVVLVVRLLLAKSRVPIAPGDGARMRFDKLLPIENSRKLSLLSLLAIVRIPLG